MPCRAFIDSNSSVKVCPECQHENVLMPCRAFIDSNARHRYCSPVLLGRVLMPCRAFIDSNDLYVGYDSGMSQLS